MSFKGLLQAAGGERSLSSALGRWCRAVSEGMDNELELPYVQVSLAVAQVVANLATGTDLIFDTIRANGGVPYSVSTGIFTLQPNSVYELECFLAWQSFGTEASDIAIALWVGAANTALVTGATTISLPMASTQNASQQPNSKIIYQTGGAPVSAKVRSDLGTGSASLSVDSFAIVKKIR